MMRIKIMITMMIIILSLLINVIMVTSYSIKINKKNIILRMAVPSYKDSLQNARNLKQNSNFNTNTNVNNNKPIVEVRKPIIQNVVAEEEDDDDSDSLPFTDEMYDHLKYVIGTLTARMKSEKPLTENELKRFKGSMDAIIKDSKQDGSSYDYSNDYENSDNDMNNEDEDNNNSSFFDISSLPEDLKNNPFIGEFQGGSTWNIAGIEDMTKEEYYDALNKKLADLKQKKIDMFGRDALNNPALSYEESLSRRGNN